jgi:hypothetical protein
VPTTAIVHASYGDSVFVIEDKKPGSPGMDKTPDGKTVQIARQQFVRTGAARGDFIAITQGRQRRPAGGERGRVQAAEQRARGRRQQRPGRSRSCRPHPANR